MSSSPSPSSTITSLAYIVINHKYVGEEIEHTALPVVWKMCCVTRNDEDGDNDEEGKCDC